MSRRRNTRKNSWLACLAAVALLSSLGCSADSPTAPEQVATDPPTTGSGSWRISVRVSPSELEADSGIPATVQISVESKVDGSSPPNGTNVSLTTSLGEFDSLDSGLSSTGATLQRGQASVLLFPGDVVASGTVVARYDGSQGRDEFRVAGAADPFITAISPSSGPEAGGTRVVIEGTGFGDTVRVSFSTNGVVKLGTVQSASPTAITVITPPAGTMTEEDCDTNNDGENDGRRTVVTPADVKVEYNSQSGETRTGEVSGGFSYEPADSTCRAL